MSSDLWELSCNVNMLNLRLIGTLKVNLRFQLILKSSKQHVTHTEHAQYECQAMDVHGNQKYSKNAVVILYTIYSIDTKH